MTGSTAVDSAVPERLAAARQALAHHMWQDAFDAFVAADAERPLEGADLEALSEAAFFTANIDVRERSLERAFSSHLAAGDPVRAAAIALGLAIDLAFQGRTSIASGWTRRAARQHEGTSDTYAHG
jgi:hypothetical protein